MTLISRIAAGDTRSAAAPPAPPGGPATAPGPAPQWDPRASRPDAAHTQHPRAGVLLDLDTDCGFADYLRRTTPGRAANQKGNP